MLVSSGIHVKLALDCLLLSWQQKLEFVNRNVLIGFVHVLIFGPSVCFQRHAIYVFIAETSVKRLAIII